MEYSLLKESGSCIKYETDNLPQNETLEVHLISIEETNFMRWTHRLVHTTFYCRWQ